MYNFKFPIGRPLNRKTKLTIISYTYTDFNSNDLLFITKNLPDSISKGISKLPSEEHVSNITKDLYKNALKNNG